MKGKLSVRVLFSLGLTRGERKESYGHEDNDGSAATGAIGILIIFDLGLSSMTYPSYSVSGSLLTCQARCLKGEDC